MKKKIDKIKSKKLFKNVVYVAVILSIALASLLSVLPLKRTIESSTDEGDVQKIFSVDNDTLSDESKDSAAKETKDSAAKETKAKPREAISFIRQDEPKEDASVEEDKKKDTKEDTSVEEDKKKDTKEDTSGVEDKKKDTKEDASVEEDKKKNTKEDASVEEVKKKDTKEDASGVEGKKEDNKKINEQEEREVFLIGNTSCIVPLSGDIVKDFSGDKLVYFKSTDEWRVHKGIDIKALVGTPVKAVRDGYVDAIENDEKSGITVVIKHSKREKSVYKNLANQELVMPNQIIKQGDIIGRVGDVSGCGGDSHLHFEIMKNDRAVNPKNYIQFSSK